MWWMMWLVMNGAMAMDADGDGHDSVLYGGDDCDDSDPTVHPGAVDVPGDGRDANCDGKDGEATIRWQADDDWAPLADIDDGGRVDLGDFHALKAPPAEQRGAQPQEEQRGPRLPDQVGAEVRLPPDDERGARQPGVKRLKRIEDAVRVE